jgi:DNA-binding response OmpR family regulator
MRLLLVEDEPDLAAVVQSGLTQSGYAVEWVERGSEALERLAEGGYSLVLLDVMLPDTDGWKVCETLRRRRDPVPVLMLTARDSVEDRVHGWNPARTITSPSLSTFGNCGRECVPVAA